MKKLKVYNKLEVKIIELSAIYDSKNTKPVIY